ncbi:facilitated trehalose transporter Tret1-like [Agrilus planipennis]|uniref:Facilitated trehalose transporter Tret1-like n=1 Tax=Agrilus planipennis TaxID=224129 RepID=A0A7F5RLG6_AGRPL|nr:facilitated trehalose transporter Tret1-like [Agrilus planipennis]
MVTLRIFNGKIKFGRDENKQWTQILAAITISMYAYLLGVSSNWTSPAIPKLISNDSHIPMTFEQTAYFGVLQSFCMAIFSFAGVFIGDAIGRKRTACIISVLQITTWLFIGFAQSPFLLYASRVTSGMCDALFLFSVLYYVTEITEKHIRGRIGILAPIWFSIGALVINMFGYYYSIRTTAFVMVIPPFIHFMVFSLMPESPYWLIQKDRLVEAKKQLQILRWREDVDKEFEEMTDSVRKQFTERGSYKDLFVVKSNRKAFVMALIARMAQQFSGTTAINGFMQYIFEEAGDGIPRHVSASICAALAAAASLSVTSVIDKYGRKPLMVISAGACSVTLFALSIFFYVKSTEVDTSSVSWLPLVFMLAFIAFYSSGLAIIPALILGELFPAPLKLKAVLVLTPFYGFFMMFTTKIFQLLVDNVAFYSPFLFYALITSGMTLTLYFTLIETKNKTFDEIQNILKGK